MKVVHIIEALGGGVYTYFADLSTFFGDAEIRNDVNTTIIYSGNRKEIDPKKVRSEFSSGVSLVEVNMVREFSPLADLKSTFKLWRELKKINPDIIHLHSSKASVLGRIAAFFLFKKKKVFYTPHGYAFLRTDIAAVKRKFYWQIEKRMQQFFGGITIACGDTEYEIAQKIGKSKLVRNGIDLLAIRKYFLPHQNSKLTIGIVARITAARKPELFNEIAKRFPEFDFIWIGDGELKHLITAPNIKFTGWILDKKTVLKTLNSIDIYLQTSAWEGLPIAVLEAMALQKPVVATNIIGNKDVVLHNETGFLFDDIGELETYFGILEEAKMRTELGKNAFARCEDLFDKNKNFKQLLDLYTK
ncbi:glycosyltransferase [Flavobacterium sp. Fl-77]|uniref:Glycosyltransferase n=1 Tax=Flavobacterium flavipigmentatum TaxID=2893884 RepID=A0AAJ2SEC3_9FLAO|nr:MULTISPECIES: glycosyltransferase [unclassified Flavobacterium]MDX6180982.1 glycosyltransferase [Flavobacterium sp. Fl-33]MDX6184583.1 glycosyltransferase [Flavobacterium sp. Fl-77]UFH39687.1 glycosyltransferase [Flavobacterium sp. F-70]